SGTTFTLCNADVTLSNSAPGSAAVSIGGAASANSLALYNAPASMSSSDLFRANPMTVSGSVLTNTGNLTLANDEVMNFVLGTNPATIAVAGNLNLNGVINVTNGPGFTSTNYTLFTYTGSLSGQPVIGAVPAGYNCVLNTSTQGIVIVAATYTGITSRPTTNL